MSLPNSLYGAYYPAQHFPEKPFAYRISDEQVLDIFQKTIVSQMNPAQGDTPAYVIERFLYALAMDIKSVTEKWVLLRQRANRPYSECFKIICNAYPPSADIVHFALNPQNEGMMIIDSPNLPIIIPHTNIPPFPLRFIGPPVSAYLLATAVKRDDLVGCVLMKTVYNLGYGIIPTELHGAQSYSNRQLMPGTDIRKTRFFCSDDSKIVWKRHCNSWKELKQLCSILQNHTNKHLPEEILKEISTYLPRLIRK